MLAGAWSSWQTYQFFTRLNDSGFGPNDDVIGMATKIDDFATAYVWVAGGLFLSIVATFCVWTYRAARNAKGLSEFPQRISPAWAVGWYFIPLANFWKPFQGMRETWSRSAWPPALKAPPILNVWWILWIALGIVDRLVGRLFGSEEFATLAAASAAMMVIHLLWLAPTAMLAWIVDRITKMQIAKHAANPEGATDVQRLGEESAYSGRASAV